LSVNNTNNLRNTVIVIVLATGIGFGVSITAYFIICEDCGPLSQIFFDNDVSLEIICSNDPTCRSLDNSTEIDGYNFTPIGQEKINLLKELVRQPIIQNALNLSNEKDSHISDDVRIQIYIQREKEWINSKELTPLMKSIIHNDVSDSLRDNLIIQSDNFDNVTFGEHILTNVYGGNVAISVKTDNYDQSRDDWWQQAFYDKDGRPFARQCEFDSSAEIFSEDLIIKIKDNESGEFIGILNSATPCDVLYKPSIP
jgi:hypothetical protein